MIRAGKIASLALCAAALLPARAQGGRAFITTKQIGEAINSAGIHVSSEQITLLANVVASKSDPILKLQSVQRWGEQRVMARLECVNPGECLPFMVAIKVDPSDIDHLAVALHKAQSASGAPALPVVRSGSKLTLLLEGKHVRIQVPVISLENGAIGQSIRVTSIDRRLNHEGRVVSSSILRGGL